ncbi:DUF551 domain-containing protein [Escherichia coli]|uniref:DUF551 domain-containing protein n=1 Tax=Escherichia coli TaxID=562 RepID=UPI00202BB1D8|nr:DUF551 domain-containing protein [Escherichia coli]
MTTITDKKQYPGEQYLNELITNIEFAARAPVEVVRAMAAELQKRREADGAEPVAWVMADDLRDNAIVSTPAYPCLDDAKERTIGSLIALYAAPPVPVIPAALPENDDEDGHDIDYLEPSEVYSLGRTAGWNACRAAMLQSQGNCIKDGWISCSDRMPEDTKMLLAFSQGEIVAAYWNWVVNPIDYKKYRAFTYLSGNILDDVTHWMPLPEPPL